MSVSSSRAARTLHRQFAGDHPVRAAAQPIRPASRPARASSEMTSSAQPTLMQAISGEIAALYARAYGHHRTTATTYINDRVVLCVLEKILTDHETGLIDAGSSSTVIDGRVAFQTDTEDEFTEAIERLTHRRVVAFMSANQTLPGVAAELFFLDAAPLATALRPT